jgi:hypothetical protein
MMAGELDGPLNLVRTEASGTSVHMAGSTIDNSLDTLHIGLPSTIGTSVGVGDLDTKGNALTTIITLRHSLHLLSVNTHNFALFGRLSIISKIAEKSKSFFAFFLVF